MRCHAAGYITLLRRSAAAAASVVSPVA